MKNLKAICVCLLRKKILVLICLLSLTMIHSCFACTIFNATKGDTTLVGNNEDWNLASSKVWFSPPSQKKHGWIGFGFDTGYPLYPEGGMNDQGLVFDWAALTARSDVTFPPEKQYFNCYAPVKILESCATLEEVIAMYQHYNEPVFRRAHIMWGDRNGNSAIIEWGENDLAIIHKTSNYQVLTNFNITNPQLAGWYPCWRYNTAHQMLQNNDVSIANFRSILDAVHQEGNYPTQYSNIYDLHNRVVYVYHHHNFNKVIKIDLIEELNQGTHFYDLPSLFNNVNVIPNETQIPEELRLHQNYPNPFNPLTAIKYYLPESAHVTLTLFNLSGQEIETLVNGFQTSGNYEVTWQAKGLSSGVYYCRLQAGNFSKMKKLILQK